MFKAVVPRAFMLIVFNFSFYGSNRCTIRCSNCSFNPASFSIVYIFIAARFYFLCSGNIFGYLVGNVGATKGTFVTRLAHNVHQVRPENGFGR